MIRTAPMGRCPICWFSLGDDSDLMMSEFFMHLCACHPDVEITTSDPKTANEFDLDITPPEFYEREPTQ